LRGDDGLEEGDRCVSRGALELRLRKLRRQVFGIHPSEMASASINHQAGWRAHFRDNRRYAPRDQIFLSYFKQNRN
jgi:hypothetical protein